MYVYSLLEAEQRNQLPFCFGKIRYPFLMRHPSNAISGFSDGLTLPTSSLPATTDETAPSSLQGVVKRRTLIRLDDVQGLEGAFLAGFRPHFMFFTDRSLYPNFIPMTAE